MFTEVQNHIHIRLHYTEHMLCEYAMLRLHTINQTVYAIFMHELTV